MRRIALIVATSAALIACGQPATSTAPGEAAAQQGDDAAVLESQSDFIDRCTREMVAENPQASRWAGDTCRQNWDMVVAAGPIAEAILAAAPASGAVDPGSLRGRLTMAQWDARPEGTLIASGRLGRDVSVQVDRSGPSLNFFWQATGEPIPYDVINALRGRGAEVAMIGCSNFGGGETNKSYRINAPGHAPFGLSVYDRVAPTANASSFYNVGMNLSGQTPTLAQLRSDGSEWSPTCSP